MRNLVPLFRTVLSLPLTTRKFRPSKGNQSANFVAPTEVLFTPLASSLLLWHVHSHRFPSLLLSLFHKKKELVMCSAPLCSCSGTNSPHRSARSCQLTDTKIPSASAAVLGNLKETNLRLCLALGLLSLNRLLSLLDVWRLSTFCATWNSTAHWRARSRSNWHRALYPRPESACQHNLHKNSQPGHVVHAWLLVLTWLPKRGCAVAVTAPRPRSGRCGGALAWLGDLVGGEVRLQALQQLRLGHEATIRSTASPPLNRIMVGMPVTPKSIGVC